MKIFFTSATWIGVFAPFLIFNQEVNTIQMNIYMVVNALADAFPSVSANNASLCNARAFFMGIEPEPKAQVSWPGLDEDLNLKDFLLADLKRRVLSKSNYGSLKAFNARVGLPLSSKAPSPYPFHLE